MRTNTKLLTLLLFATVAFMAINCDSSNDPKKDTNPLVGTWRYDDPSSDYWVLFVFNENKSGTRTDADGENNNFTYSFTSSSLTFSGQLTGTVSYTIAGGNKLTFDGTTFEKQ